MATWNTWGRRVPDALDSGLAAAGLAAQRAGYAQLCTAWGWVSLDRWVRVRASIMDSVLHEHRWVFEPELAAIVSEPVFAGEWQSRFAFPLRKLLLAAHAGRA